MATQTETDFEVIKDLFTQETGYTTPKVDSRGAVFRDGHILLVRERADGRWSLPGGWIDVHESPGESVVREIWEETGYQTRALKLLAVFDKNKHNHPPTIYHTYKLFFLCELLGGSPTHTLETDGVDFFPENALPELSVNRVTAGQIARLFEHYRHPNWPTDFD
ncbi:MAG: ADP-ribose pyrophosphatase [Candidatus Entotheonella factor]|uniref:ADP-ribose pyrophosphatase n=1 Tax=Entotheonella factor TaxID=1429438 RepID=W4LYR2_ENTF1|nr:MAG: ADP-ribose pyrophosphatase [Candidatus Entotheonella factor]